MDSDNPIIMSVRIFFNDSKSQNRDHYKNCNLNLQKKGLRVFGVAESFRKFNIKSTLAGVVMRRDLIIDGAIFGTATLGGNDSTENILYMFKSLKRDDINCIMLGGLIISMYNIIDAQLIQNETGLPVIGITFEDSKGIESNIRYHFADSFQLKLDQYAKLGRRDQVTLKTGKSIFIRYWGLSPKDAIRLLNSFTLQGAIPEPIRIAKLVARASTNMI